MGEYTPPFSVSARAIRLVAEISALVERYASAWRPQTDSY